MALRMLVFCTILLVALVTDLAFAHVLESPALLWSVACDAYAEPIAG